ncbi:MFS transporter [Streptomyces aureoverticillatus]|uniref:MFS transporter n=1 Tax=Streptomyces aureoverticillatus TaxID=66871 RepID=UPI0013DC5979|nr:MFS transporter [Streptomyces aureoverticillatus]QIB45914.1 aromatic acid/H+ symport family MFS transporter [Streptomyces aureoverticillatus]
MMLASGWSANQFSALLGAYRSELGLTDSAATGLFAVYVVGLIPGLLVAGPLADRRGRRRIALGALAVNLLSTVLLTLGVTATGWLLPGRFLTGVSAGVLLAAGSAWIKELSSPPYVASGAPASTASRRAGLFVSAGFASGGLAAALIAEWAPHPMVTAYVPHVLLAAGAWLAARSAPETRTVTVRRGHSGGGVDAHSGGAVARGGDGADDPVRQLRRTVLPLAPWVFAAPTLGFVTLPGLVHAGLVHTGIATAVVPGTGLLVQPLARRAAASRHGAAGAGLLAITLGLALAAWAAHVDSQPWAMAAAATLGAGYGFTLTHGLTQVAVAAPPHSLARLTSYFWTAAYTGMFAPYAVTLLTDHTHLTPPQILTVAAVLAAATCAALPLLNSPSGRGT